MRAIYAPMSVGDYCSALNEGAINVNQDYQRNSGLWSSTARSFFIESIILQYPIPKLFLYANIDLATRKTIKEIVDGQQRSEALRLFYNGKIRLSSKLETEDLRGMRYSQLSGEHQSTFLSYQLPIDQFSGLPDTDVREAFRRMNASNVPLNDEEQRNAVFQGPLKWFIQRLGKRYNERLYSLGLFSKRELVRMSDTKTYADIVFALDRGLYTTKAAQLDTLYKKYNATFDKEDEFNEKIVYGIEEYLNRPELHDSTLMKPHMFQTLILSLIDRQFGGSLINQASDLEPAVVTELDELKVDLDTLTSALKDPDDYPQLHNFTNAALRGTNVGAARATRLLYLSSAI